MSFEATQASAPALTTRLVIALDFAARKHRDQRRKDAEESPYINHPIAVATVLAVEGDVTDESILLAASLHDTVEDTETTFEELTAHFGKDVSDLVREVTDDKILDKKVRKELQIEHAAKSSAQAKQIKIADKICNIRDITNSPPVGWSVQRRADYLQLAQKVVTGCRGVNTKLDQCFDEAVGLALESLRQRTSFPEATQHLSESGTMHVDPDTLSRAQGCLLG